MLEIDLNQLFGGNHVTRGPKVYRGYFWKKGLPQDMESNLANNCPEGPVETRQLFLNRLAVKAGRNVINLEQVTASKKRKFNDGQTKYQNSAKLFEDRIHEINQACVKAFVV